MQEIEYQVRHNAEEYRDYLEARFNPSRRLSSLKTFEWKGHRWAYKYTDFDDEDEFDVIYRKVNTSQSLDHIEVPPSVISASLIVSGFFETLGIKNWELGNCRNRF